MNNYLKVQKIAKMTSKNLQLGHFVITIYFLLS